MFGLVVQLAVPFSVAFREAIFDEIYKFIYLIC